jgi:predicted enzyme related to lactoylglutathione lyase
MGEVSRYPEGTFNWIDLGTPDVAGAKAFYQKLFGWETEDVSVGEDTYTLCRLRGRDVAAIHEHSSEERNEWSSYVSVDDVDTATSRARDLGATVMIEPFDIPGAGRLSLIQDPGGAIVSLWQPMGHIGAGLVNEVGTWSWNELVTSEVDAAKAFYAELFGWNAEVAPSPIPRSTFKLGDLLVGGAHAPGPQEGDEARWTVSFRVEDADEAVARVEELGGHTRLPPLDIPIGRFAIVSDPVGATFTVTAFPAGAWGGVDGS